MPRVGLFTIITIGDIGAISMDSAGCDEPSCNCGGVSYGLMLHQVDGQGLRLNAPKESWVALTAVLAKTMAAEHPNDYVQALDFVDAQIQYPGGHQPMIGMPATVVFSDREMLYAYTTEAPVEGMWVLYEQTGKLHQVREVYGDELCTCCGLVFAADEVVMITDTDTATAVLPVCGTCRKAS